MDYFWTQWSGFWIFPLLCFAFMAIMMLLMFRRGGCMPFGRHEHKPSVREIVERRYASGEIDKTQYDALRRELG